MTVIDIDFRSASFKQQQLITERYSGEARKVFLFNYFFVMLVLMVKMLEIAVCL